MLSPLVLTVTHGRVAPVRLIYFRFLSGACVSADAATFFTSADAFGSRSSLLAAEATDFEVFSDLAN
jgi:hypothetical protein